MPDIFISWSSPDVDKVKPLCARLRELGFNLWEYSEDMAGGDAIHDRILAEIDRASLAIICLSAYSANRPWIATEVAWCVKNLKEGRLQHIVPVKVGPLDFDATPHLIREENLNLYDLTISSDDHLLKLAGQIQDKFGRKAPVVLPAAIFAMTHDQSTSLFAQGNATAILQHLEKLCAVMGMPGPPDLFQALAQRYHERAEDLTPFHSRVTVATMASEIIAAVNARRAVETPPARPVFLRWVHGELSVNPIPQWIRNLWRQGDSLLVVDSVSTLHVDVQAQLLRLPASDHPERAALLWLPPFTRHTSMIEQILQPAAQAIGRLGDAFDDWPRHPERPIAFDPSTALAVRLWLHRALLRIPDGLIPQADRLQEMQAQSPGRTNVSELLGSLG